MFIGFADDQVGTFLSKGAQRRNKNQFAISSVLGTQRHNEATVRKRKDHTQARSNRAWQCRCFVSTVNWTCSTISLL